MPEVLTQSESQYALLSSIVECSQDAIYSESLEQAVLSWNAAAEKIYGYSAEEIIGKNFMPLIPPEHREEYREMCARIKRGERVDHFETTRLRKDGKKIWVSISLSPILNGQGEVLGISKIGRDITESKKREEDLLLKERVLREVAQGVIITDASQMIVYANPTFELLTGYNSDEVVGRNCKFLQGPDTDPETIDKLGLALRTGKSFHGEILNYRKNGTSFWNDLNISPVHEDEGTLSRFVGIQRDVTERRHTQELLRKSELHHRSLFENMLEGYCYCHLLYEDGHPQDYIYLEVNRAFETQTGLKNVSGKKVSEVLPGMYEANPEQFVIYERVASSGNPERFETYSRLLKMWFSVSVYSYESEHFISVFENITERKTNEARFRLLVESNAQNVFFWNLKGEILDANDSFLKLIGYTREELDARHLSLVGLTPPQYADLDLHAREEIRVNNVCAPYEKEFIRKDGSLVPILIGAAVIEDSPENGVAFVLDITLLKDAEHRLTKALEDQKALTSTAQAALESKGQFLAVMSHEIRTPMNGILGFAELLISEDSLSPEAQEHLHAILKSGESLLRIIDDILDYSRIDAGKLVIENTNFSIHDLVVEIKSLFEFSIREKGLSFECSVDKSLPPQITGDAGRIRQILLNLIGNAIKFTSSGSIGLDISHRRLDSQVLIEFSVKDTGLGIPLDKQGMIFESFTQADSTISRRYGGSGLGLAISKSLAKLMGGSIELKSQPEKGSTFSLLIPQQRAIFVAPVIASKEPAVLTNDLASHYPMSILAVDDNDLNLRLIIAMLQRLGYSPFSARNGLEAVEIYQKEHPQCILMDIQMPVLNGIDATKQIREIETASARPRAYISALTANRVPEDQAHCIGAGMNFCLTKPVKIQNIADVVIAASAIAVGAV